MDLAPTKSPPHESDTDTEAPLPSHLYKALSLTNASSLKTSHHQPTPLSSLPSHHHHQMVVSYKECLKNHAASLGGLALDGCGEFMPTHTSPLESTSLKCAACGCHRNFHRREPYAGHLPRALLHWTSSPSPISSGPSPSPSSPASPTPQNSIFPSAPHMLLALSAPLDENHNYHTSTHPTVMNPHGKKRARTKFTKEQKQKMQTFAEKLGWKMLRGNDERMVEDFCNEVGVKRNVFKVWMHNNKHRIEKGQSYDFNSTTKFDINGGNGIGLQTKVSSENKDNDNNVKSSSYDSFDRIQIRTKADDATDGSSPST